MTLTAKHLNDICLINHADKSKTCRYLCRDDLHENKWHCRKLRPSEKKKIDKIADNYSGRGSVPLGDNCPGYPLLRHIDQGYDVD